MIKFVVIERIELTTICKQTVRYDVLTYSHIHTNILIYKHVHTY